MTNSFFTFRQRLFALAGVALVAFLVLGGITYSLIANIRGTHKAESDAKAIEEITLKMQKHQKDFISSELTNPHFYESGESEFLIQFQKKIDSANVVIGQLKKNHHITKAKVNDSLINLISYYENYSENFVSLVSLLQKKGFKDYGTIGKMRSAIHEVENYIIKNKINPTIRVHMLTLRRHEKDYLLRKDLKYKDKFNEETKKMNAAIAKSNMGIKTKQRMSELIKNYKKRFFTVISLDTIIGLNDETGVRKEINNEVQKIEPNVKHIAMQVAKQAELKIKRTMIGFAITLILGSALIIFLSTYIIQRIQLLLGGEPAEVAEIADNIAKGNLVLKIKKKKAQTGVMGSMRQMLKQLQGLAKEISIVTEMISSASDVLNQKAEDLSHISIQQAAAAEQVLSSVEEMAANIEKNNENAKETEKISLMAAKNVKILGEAANDSTKSVEEISKKITVIDDIVFQTRLLSLNASIIAAKAGENGQGFNVIAYEVQKLAGKSKLEADEIEKLSKITVQKTNNAGQMVEEIIQDITKTSGLVQQITYAGEEQNTGAKQINSFIRQLNTDAQQNAAASLDLSNQASELEKQAKQLKKIAGFFSVE